MRPPLPPPTPLRWLLERRLREPFEGTGWDALPPRFDSRDDVEAELTIPSGLLSPGDLVRVVGPGIADHWVVDGQGRGRRLPLLSTYVHDSSAILHFIRQGTDWADGWAHCPRANLLLALAAGVGIPPRALVVALLAAVRPTLDALLDPTILAEPLATLDAWAERRAGDPALWVQHSRMWTTALAERDLARHEALSSLSQVLVAAMEEGAPNSVATAVSNAARDAAGAQGIHEARTDLWKRGRFQLENLEAFHQAERVRAVLPLSAYLDALDVL